MKLAVDTNTLVSGFLWDGIPAQLITAALAGRARLFVTQPLLLELQATLRRPKFSARLASRGETPDSLVLKYRSAATEIEPAHITPPPNLRDADDIAILACAAAAEADLIVSGDEDLLVLRVFGNIPIINAAQALELIGR